MTGRRWGKAGVPLTAAEAAANNQRAGKERLRSAQATARTRRKWAAGLVVPYNITAALDARSLYGPEVDRACGVEEPAVDMWEAGKLYPTWEQLCALAELTGNTPEWFTIASRPLSPMYTSLRFHMPIKPDPEPPLMRFPAEVVALCAGTNPDPRDFAPAAAGAQLNLFTTNRGDNRG
jgi:hypothetical protein